MSRNILVAGTYGVGKSYLANIIEKEASLKVYTASSLIKHDRRDKSVESVSNNQELLTQAVTDINISQPSIVIDGHFCILNKENMLEPIDLAVFRNLSLSKIVLLFDEPEQIEKRLLSRDGHFFDLTSISKMQDLELHHGESVSRSLAIPLIKFNISTGDIQSLLAFIKADS